nr:MAG TPA: hypothetical protein [Caudoviricetes sp.]
MLLNSIKLYRFVLVMKIKQILIHRQMILIIV